MEKGFDFKKWMHNCYSVAEAMSLESNKKILHELLEINAQSWALVVSLFDNGQITVDYDSNIELKSDTGNSKILYLKSSK